MGLFKRNDPARDAQAGKPRPSISSEAQAAELRGRARRRLAGAVALVLAAVIILPMLLDSQPARVSDNIPIRVPDRNTSYQPNVSDPQAAQGVADAGAASANGGAAVPAPAGNGNSAGNAATAQSGAGAPPAAANGPGQAGGPAAVTPPEVRPPVARNENRTSDARPESRPEARTETKPTPKPREAPAQPPQQQQRTDDGARALALLEGKSASGAAATSSASSSSSSTADAKGNFVLQIAAYTTQADAQGRRDKLHAAGITNAFVQEANVGGKQQYRLRVGPFPSREAARAAQARLRSLGYDNGFIAAQ